MDIGSLSDPEAVPNKEPRPLGSLGNSDCSSYERKYIDIPRTARGRVDRFPDALSCRAGWSES